MFFLQLGEHLLQGYSEEVRDQVPVYAAKWQIFQQRGVLVGPLFERLFLRIWSRYLDFSSRMVAWRFWYFVERRAGDFATRIVRPLCTGALGHVSARILSLVAWQIGRNLRVNEFLCWGTATDRYAATATITSAATIHTIHFTAACPFILIWRLLLWAASCRFWIGLREGVLLKRRLLLFFY